MRMFIVAAGLLALPLAGAMAQDGPRCRADPGCGGDYPLRIAVAPVPGTPLTWSPAHADIEPPPIGRAPILFGRTIPLGEIIGRRVKPIGRLPEPVMFNKPMADLGPNDPGVVLMPIGTAAGLRRCAGPIEPTTADIAPASRRAGHRPAWPDPYGARLISSRYQSM